MTVINVGNSSPEWVNYVASLVLVLVGAGLTYGTQLFFERKKDREEKSRHAWSLLHTTQAMVENLVNLDVARIESLALANAKNRIDEAFWQKWLERVGYGDPNIRFSADELTVLSMMHDGDFTTKMRDLENAHRIFVEAAQKLSELRAAFGAYCSSQQADGTLVTLKLPPSALPILTKLNTLGDSFEKTLPSAVADAKQAAAELGPRLKKFYGFKKFATLDYNQPRNKG